MIWPMATKAEQPSPRKRGRPQGSTKKAIAAKKASTARRKSSKRLQKIDPADVVAAMDKHGVNPAEILAMLAKGDPVGLGLVTQKRQDQEVEASGQGLTVLIPLEVRRKAAQDLLTYAASRKLATQPAEAGSASVSITVQLPDNGRGVKPEGEPKE